MFLFIRDLSMGAIVKLSNKKPLEEEIKYFVKNKKVITDINFSENIIKTISFL